MGNAPTVNAPIESSDNKKRILILEDEDDLLQLLYDAFRNYGFEVDAYSDPEGAVRSFVNKVNYDLILMDLKLGEIDGRTIYKKFKERDSTFKICILTGLEFDIPAFKKICPSFEEKFLIKKPVKLSSMIQTINSILG
jgi:DNA-binding NtrC family response regulator